MEKNNTTLLTNVLLEESVLMMLVYVLLNILVFILVIAGNALTITAFVRFSSLQTVTNTFVWSLAVIAIKCTDRLVKTTHQSIVTDSSY